MVFLIIFSKVQSVHFPDTYDMNITEHMNEVTQPKTVDQIFDMINHTRKRDLTNWNYAEHYEPKVLVQVSFFNPNKKQK